MYIAAPTFLRYNFANQEPSKNARTRESGYGLSFSRDCCGPPLDYKCHRFRCIILRDRTGH